MSALIKTAKVRFNDDGNEYEYNFGLITKEWEGNLANHPDDNRIFYWLDQQEWESFGVGFSPDNDWEVIGL